MTTPTVYRVSDGIALRVLSTDRFKAGMLSVSAVLPIDRKKTPLTSLLLSVLRRGTEKYPSLAEINRRLDYLYGTVLSIRNFYRGDCQIIGFSADLLDGSYLPMGEDLTDGILELIEEILFHPCLDENGLLLPKYVESEKQLQIDAIRAQKNNPRVYASDRCREWMMANEPSGVPIYGTEEEILAVSTEELTAHWHSLLDGISFDCFYVGQADATELCNALRERLADHTAERPALLFDKDFVKSAKVTHRYEEELPVSQGQLLLAYRTGTRLDGDGFYALSVMNELLGLSPVSKLFVNVRERLSLCYFCSSHYNAYKGILTVHCGLDPKNRVLAESEILSQVDAVRHGEFSDWELDVAKKSLINAYRQLQDSPVALENFYFGRTLMGVCTTAEECRAAFDAVTRSDVTEAARALSLDTVYFLNGTLAGEEDFDDGEGVEFDE